MDTTNPSTVWLQPAQLRAVQGSPHAPRLLDVRRAAAFDASDRLLAGASHVPGDDSAALLAAAAGTAPVVLHCVYGHAVSQSAAAALRQAGINASVLAGGLQGGQDGVDTPEAIARWRAHPPITLRKRLDWGVTGRWADAPSRWVTRQRPKIDRLACPWLLRRLVDPRAQFFYVPTDQVLTYAAQTGAVAFDIPGAPVTHVGELCSFDALIHGFDLRDPALEVLATIVRGADTDRLDLHPASAGLLAVSLGLANLHAGDDHALLAAAIPLYDALWAWCQDSVAGRAERHQWTGPSGRAV